MNPLHAQFKQAKAIGALSALYGIYILKKCTNMDELRDEIDQVDRLIVPLLLERIQLIAQAGHIKTDRNTVRDDWRIEDVVAKVKAEASKHGGNTDYVETLYRYIIEYSINYEFDVWDAVYGVEAKRKA